MIRKILLIEYDLDMIDEIRSLLHHESIEMTVAGNEIVAKALLNKEHFDLIICEKLLPKSHGVTLCGYIKSNYPGSQTVIISDKLDDPAQRDEIINHGANELFEKPLHPEGFKEKILKLLNIKTPGSGNENIGDTTNLYVIPFLKELQEKEKSEPSKESFDDIIKELKKNENPDSFEIEID